jgi:hypothetical protein
MTDRLTRRTALAAIGGAGALAVPAAALAAATRSTGSDAAILNAWEARQSALARIESRGTFFDAEEQSPADIAIYDQADEVIATATATTPQGLLAQAWVALAYAQDSFTEGNRRQNELIRNTDYAGLLAEGDYLDWEIRTQLAVIRSLRTMTGEA